MNCEFETTLKLTNGGSGIFFLAVNIESTTVATFPTTKDGMKIDLNHSQNIHIATHLK